MKLVDADIKIGMISYGDEYKANLRTMLDIAGRDIDFLADRAWGEDGLMRMLDVMRAYNAEHGTSIKYCYDTEWLQPIKRNPDVFNNVVRADWQDETKSYRFSKWRYAMNIMRNFMMWQRQGGDVLFVNFNNFANTHSQCVIDTPKEGAYLTAAGRVFELLSPNAGGVKPLKIDSYEPDSRADFQVQAAWDIDRRLGLVLYALNMTDQTRRIDFDVAPLERTFTRCETSRLEADSLTMSTALSDAPDMIRPRRQCPGRACRRQRFSARRRAAVLHYASHSLQPVRLYQCPIEIQSFGVSIPIRRSAARTKTITWSPAPCSSSQAFQSIIAVDLVHLADDRPLPWSRASHFQLDKCGGNPDDLRPHPTLPQ